MHLEGHEGSSVHEDVAFDVGFCDVFNAEVEEACTVVETALESVVGGGDTTFLAKSCDVLESGGSALARVMRHAMTMRQARKERRGRRRFRDIFCRRKGEEGRRGEERGGEERRGELKEGISSSSSSVIFLRAHELRNRNDGASCKFFFLVFSVIVPKIIWSNRFCQLCTTKYKMRKMRVPFNGWLDCQDFA